MSERKPTFFSSDWHIGHENVLKFDQRPFKDLEHMHRVLINNYNSCVPAHGICYFLGDMGLGNSEQVRKVLSELNGTKVLILGNHDKNSNSMYNTGFNVVLNSASMWIANHEVTMSHCPLRGVWREAVDGMKNANPDENWHGESRHEKFSLVDHGQFHLHGHIHSGPANDKKRTDGKQYDVGAPGNGYRPVSISEIESWISKYGR